MDLNDILSENNTSQDNINSNKNYTFDGQKLERMYE